LIDAGDPQAGGVFPVGRLREPLSALGRASEIVATQGSDPSRVKDLVRQYNSNAPVFRSRVIPIQWVDVASAEARPVACPIDGRVAAFCGLGNPPSFWRTLRDLKLDPTV
jgi:tetraacyldisaccharide-1-P 4'-kinase